MSAQELIQKLQGLIAIGVLSPDALVTVATYDPTGKIDGTQNVICVDVACKEAYLSTEQSKKRI
jgi:hypothetical protein